MKITLIAPTAIPARTANSIQVMKMAQALSGLGHAVQLFAPGEPSALSEEELADHYGLHFEGNSLPFETRWLPAHPSLRSYDYAWRAVDVAGRWGADLTYTRLPQAAALASWRGLPTIYEIHDLPGGRMGPLLLRAFKRGRGARHLVVITHALADDLHEGYGVPRESPFTLIAPDGVDLRRYGDVPPPQVARKALGLPERFTIGYSGHLYGGRGVSLMMALAGHLPEITLLLVGGEGEVAAQVEEAVLSMALENVVVTGFVPNAELPRYQAACDVLLMPYQSKVAASSGGDIAPYLSPMKMFEYLACGRPVLASDLPVLSEVLSPENARILPAADVNAWVAAVEELRADPELRQRLGQAARQTAKEYTWEARARLILEWVER